MNKNTKFENAESIVSRKNILREWSAIEYEFSPPSALKCEQRYAQYGIKLPFKIYYQFMISLFMVPPLFLSRQH